MGLKLLIVEDEPQLRKELVDFFEAQGLVSEYAGNYLDAADKVHLYQYDMVILDITLPGGNGLQVLNQLKKKSPETGVIILSAKNSLDDKLKGLQLGADDYLTKPFHLTELNARIQSIIRRRQLSGNSELTLGNVTYHYPSHHIAVDGQPLDLTKKEFGLLHYFLIHPNRVLSKSAIVTHLWGDDYDMPDNYDFLYVHLRNLRQKLSEAGAGLVIKTIYGTGYKMDLL